MFSPHRHNKQTKRTAPTPAHTCDSGQWFSALSTHLSYPTCPPLPDTSSLQSHRHRVTRQSGPHTSPPVFFFLLPKLTPLDINIFRNYACVPSQPLHIFKRRKKKKSPLIYFKGSISSGKVHKGTQSRAATSRNWNVIGSLEPNWRKRNYQYHLEDVVECGFFFKRVQRREEKRRIAPFVEGFPFPDSLSQIIHILTPKAPQNV